MFYTYLSLIPKINIKFLCFNHFHSYFDGGKINAYLSFGVMKAKQDGSDSQ